MDVNALKDKIPAPKTVGLLALTLIMLVIFLISLGSQIPQLWPLSIELAEPSALSSYDGSLAVIDQQYTRFTKINGDGTVEMTSSIDYKDREKEQYTTVLIADEGIYYAVSSAFSDCAYIESEKVYYKKNSSNSSELIFERTYTRDQKVYGPLFNVISYSQNQSDIGLVARTPEKDKVEFISLVSKPGTVLLQRNIPVNTSKVAYLSFGEGNESCAVTTNTGELYLCNADGSIERLDFDGLTFLTHCVWDANGLLYCIDYINNALICIDPSQKTPLCTLTDQSYYSLSVGKGGEAIIVGTQNGYEVFAADAFSESNAQAPAPLYSHSGTISYSPWLIVKTIIIWLSIVYLAVCVLFVLVRLICKLIKGGQGRKVGQAAIVASVVALVIAVSTFCSIRFFMYAQESSQDSLKGICQNYANTITKVLDAASSSESAVSSEQSAYQAALSLGSALVESNAVYADINTSLRVAAGFTKNGRVLALYADAEDFSARTIGSDSVAGIDSIDVDMIYQNAAQASEEPLCQTEDRLQSTYFTACRGIISSDGSVVGFIKLYSNANNLIASYQSLCLDMMITMLGVGGGLVLIIIEGRELIRASARRRREKKKEDGRPEAWTARQFNFWGCLLSGFDSSLSVLVAQEMLAAQNVMHADLLVGLPAALAAFGLFLGTILYYFLSPRVSARTLVAFGSVGAFILFGGAAWAVWENLFPLFCLLRFGASFFLSIPAAIAYELPNRASSDDDCRELFDGCKFSSISGAALGCAICGLVAEYFGNSAIYLACMIPALIIFISCIVHIPKKVVFEEKIERLQDSQNAKTRKSMLRLFAKPPVLVLIICIVIPSMLFNGYKSILFPLFMDDQGLSKTYISTIVACSNVLIFLFLPYLMKVKRGFNRWNWQLGIMLFAAAVLAWFYVNSSPVWAVLALFLLGAAYRLCSRRSYLAKQAKAFDCSSTRANNAYSILTQLFSAVRSPVLSALAGLGQTFACLVLSGICALGAGIFAFATRNSAWRGKHVEVDEEQEDGPEATFDADESG